MHELGIVFSVADKVLEIARDNDLTEIVAITMQIGEISSVIPDYLKKCFPAAVERSPLFAHTELKIEILPARYLCHSCGESFSLAPVSYTHLDVYKRQRSGSTIGYAA